MDTEVERRIARLPLLLFHPEAKQEEGYNKPLKILVTGDRNWTDEDTIWRVLSLWLTPGDTLIHGAARGADSLCGSIAGKMGIDCVAVPAEWNTHGKAAGPIRNRKMLNMEPEVVLAFHDNLENSKGTKDCVTEARRRGITVFVHRHNDHSWEFYPLN